MTLRIGQAVQAIDVDEVDIVELDFAPALRPGEALLGCSVTADVMSGTDATPAALLVGSPEIDGTLVRQLVQGPVAGVTYRMRFVATLVDNQRQPVEALYLPCVRL